MSDAQEFFGLLEKNFDSGLEYERVINRFESSPGRDAIRATKALLENFGIEGFFVFGLEFAASFYSCIGTLSEEFLEGIKENGLLNADQVLRHLTADPRMLPQPLYRPVVDGYIRKSPFEPKAFWRHKQFEDYLKSFGIREIYYYPFIRPDTNSAGAFCLYGAGDFDNFRRSVESFGPRIEPLARAFCTFVKVNRFVKGKARRVGLLPPFPAAVVRIMAEKDLSASEVARCFGLHEVTVNKHIALAKKIVGASTLPGLVAQCLKQGYIQLDDIC